MQPLFDLCVNDVDDLLPHMKRQLMSGNAQLWIAERILKFLRETNEKQKSCVVRKLVKFDVISTMCDTMQTSDEDFVKIILECFDIMSPHREFYENQAALIAIQAMLRLSYCISKSYKVSTLFEKLIQGISDILVRSLKLDVSFDTSCILQQIVLFVKNLNIEDVQKIKLKFAAVTMLNVVLQKQTAFDENTDANMIIDICHDVIKSMTKIVKCDDEDDTILFAADLLCSTCASSSRFCFMQDSMETNETESKICEKKDDLEIYVYNTIMYVIIPYVKDANLSRLDSINFHRNLVSCLNYLYQLKNCNKDNLSNHLTANGYLKRFLYLTVRVPDNLRRSTCLLLTRILSILSKTVFSIYDTTTFANILQQSLLELPKDPTKWNDQIAEKNRHGSTLVILLYYHFLGTQENDVISLESLTARIMLLPISVPISVPILKPLWLLFAVTSLSHSRPNAVYNYENAIDQMTKILLHSEINKFYTHHINLLHYCLKCPYISPNLLQQVLNLWLIESDGDIRPLSFNYTKVVEHLLNTILAGCPKHIVDIAVKGLHYFVQIIKDDEQLTEQVADIVWRVLPDLLSSYQADTAMHIEKILELTSIIRPSTNIPLFFLIRTANNITSIILTKNRDPKFVSLVLTQAYTLLDVAMSCQLFKVLEIYIQQFQLLQLLYDYGFSKQRSQLSTAGIKLLTFIISCQKKSSVKCTKPLTIKITNLVDLFRYARKSPCCIMNGMQFICELLTLNDNGSAVVLKYIMNDNNNMYLLELYESLQTIHAQNHPMLQNMVYQSLVTLLQFCNTKANTLMPYFCTAMSTCDLILNINMECLSCHEFVILWLNYRKANAEDVPWDIGALYKTPFDEVLDKLQEYLVFLKNKEMKDAYLNLQRALSQFE